ncbi:MAG TPA: hypothetical protein VGR35_03455 [Tepidisphaeraceae bacterium]|nr:hypothetical protein [Tepidisphaeraceae bacterium]
MRRILAGLLILLITTSASAQIKAEVESIGFNNHYRPDCWTPMVVRILPEKSGTYQIHVIQEDLDGDEPTFVQEITLTGADEGNASEQRFWMYFIPQPTHGGLYDVNRGGTRKELEGQLRVHLADARGRQLMKLPITNSIINIEPTNTNNVWANPRGTKLILSVGDGRSKLIWTEYEKAVGIIENVWMVPVQSRELPEDARGYEAVDAIIWTNTEAPDPSSPTGERRMRALQRWVRGGGRLVILQPPERDRSLPWGDMLPVKVESIEDRKSVAPLAQLALPDRTREQSNSQFAAIDNMIRRVWSLSTGPFRVARAQAKPGTVVEEWIEWDPANKSDRTPYLARMGYGLGSVTWVAQDLGDPLLVRQATVGWPNVWNKVLGWNDSPLVKQNNTPEELLRPWEGGMGVDLYPSMMSGAALASKSRAFVGLAIIFFVVYWLIAGPGLYLYLVAKARAYLSWFMFAGAAIGATAVTVLVVQLVVRGDPELAHVSIVRKAAGDPAVVFSRFGLYIPQDGPQEIKLRDIDPSGDSYITAMAAHPRHVSEDSSFLSFKNYDVPVHQSGSGEPVVVAFPYRSTMRQMQARWTGIMNSAVEGAGKVVPTEDGTIQGTLTNGTGRELRNVYIAFHHPNIFAGSNDVILYLPSWAAGVTIDLTQEFKTATAKLIATNQQISTSGGRGSGSPDRSEKVWGTLRRDSEHWPAYWYEKMRNNGLGADTWDDYRSDVKRSFPMLSFYSRLPPVRNPQRIEILRRGQRQFDVGHALAAGELVVLAEARNTPIPIPLDVEGDKVGGNGTTFYQFILPLERSAALAGTDAEADAPAGNVERPGAAASSTQQPNNATPLLNPLE